MRTMSQLIFVFLVLVALTACGGKRRLSSVGGQNELLSGPQASPSTFQESVQSAEKPPEQTATASQNVDEDSLRDLFYELFDEVNPEAALNAAIEEVVAIVNALAADILDLNGRMNTTDQVLAETVFRVGQLSSPNPESFRPIYNCARNPRITGCDGLSFNPKCRERKNGKVRIHNCVLVGSVFVHPLAGDSEEEPPEEE